MRGNLWIFTAVLLSVIIAGCNNAASKAKPKPAGEGQEEEQQEEIIIPPEQQPSNKFTISGIVTGKNGSGFSLLLNGTEEYRVESNGQFLFSSELQANAVYVVTVKENPIEPIQYCNVLNGTGTVADSNISNVSVVCENAIINVNPAHQSVSRPVNQIVDITFRQNMLPSSINANNIKMYEFESEINTDLNYDSASKVLTIMPSVELKIASKYRVEVSTGVLNADGIPLAGQYNLDFSSLDYQWKTASELDDVGGAQGNTGAFVPSPRLSLNDQGHIGAIWSYDAPGPGNTRIRATVYNSTTGWSSAEFLESASAFGNSWEGDIAVDQNGKALAVWKTFTGSIYNVVTKFFEPGVGWGSETILSAVLQKGDGNRPRVVFDGSNRAFVAWYQVGTFADPASHIYVQRFTPGSGWLAEPARVDVESTSARYPNINVNNDGTAFMVWEQQIAGGTFFETNVWGSYYKPGSGWNWTIKLNNEDTLAAVPQIAVDNIGNGLAVWINDDGQERAVWSKLFKQPFTWEAAVKVQSTSMPANNAQVDMNGSGQAIAFWSELEGDLHSLWVNNFTLANGWGSAAQIEVLEGGIVPNQLNISIDDNGNAIAMWRQNSGEVWYSRYTRLNGWGAATLIDAVNNFGLDPAVLLNKNGKGVAAWRMQNIWMSRFQ